MPLTAVSSRDVPAAPPFAKRAFVVRDESGSLKRIPVRIRQDRQHQESWDWRVCLKSIVTDQAFIRLWLDGRVRIVLLSQRIEGRAVLRVDIGDLHEFAMVNPSHIGVVIEINRTRSLGGNLGKLKTGLRKDQCL